MADLILTEINRKVGKLNDAIIYDLTYGGNSASYQIASRF